MTLKNFFRNFQQGWGLRVAALLLAVLCWWVVNSGRDVTETRPLKIQYSNLPKGLVFERLPLKEGSIVLEGPLFRLRSIQNDDLVFWVDLSNARAGSRRIRVETEDLRLPMDVEASQPNPRVFSVELEEVYTGDFAVKANVRGKPKAGYEVQQVRVTPNILSVSGPKSLLSRLKELNVPVMVEGREASFTAHEKPDLALPDSENLETIAVEVLIGPIKRTRSLDRVPVVIQGGRSQIIVEPSECQIVFEGPELQMNDLGPIRVWVSAEGLASGRYRVRGQVDLPPGLRLISLKPTSFLVDVR